MEQFLSAYLGQLLHSLLLVCDLVYAFALLLLQEGQLVDDAGLVSVRLFQLLGDLWPKHQIRQHCSWMDPPLLSVSDYRWRIV